MSWLSGYKANKPAAEESREDKRLRLEAERLSRAKNRAAQRKQLQAALEAQAEADKALQELLDIDPEILSSETSSNITDKEVDELLAPETMAPDPVVAFETENGADDAKAMDNLRTVQCPFNKDDIEFWFSQLEDQMTLIGVKAQWTKKVALVRFLPPEIQSEVKSLLKLNQVAAGNDIYFRIKKELLELFGQKPEDAYQRAKNRVMTGKPSQLGKAIIDDLTDGDLSCNNCARTVWGMFRESLPIVVRNHIADLPFTKDTYRDVFKKADQVWDSNRAAEPLPSRQVAAVVASTKPQEPSVAAIQRKNQNGQGGQGNKNGQNKNQQNQNNKNNGQNGGQETKKPKPAKLTDDNLCRIHAKWKDNATFCAAPWGCRMKNIYKAPQ